jgi:hypothetical protein
MYSSRAARAYWLGSDDAVSSFAKALGFTPLPAMFFLFLGGTVITYLLQVNSSSVA